MKVMLDLTLYLMEPTELEFEYLINLYEALCPRDRLLKFKIAEIPIWSSIASPMLTRHARAAARAGVRRPYFEPARERIRQNRAFEAQYWDGWDIDEPDGSWSFNCQRAHLRSGELFTFARILVPLQADPDILRIAALDVAEHVPLYSGHGGLVFVYEPSLLEDAFDEIYVRARRFWGVDIECMNCTLWLTKRGIKGANWLTLVGQKWAASLEIPVALADLAKAGEVTTVHRRHATVLVAGPHPVPGDQHRPDRSLHPYEAIANALKPLFLDEHPDFPGERFVTNGNTVGWIRRFIDPAGWR